MAAVGRGGRCRSIAIARFVSSSHPEGAAAGAAAPITHATGRPTCRLSVKSLGTPRLPPRGECGAHQVRRMLARCNRDVVDVKHPLGRASPSNRTRFPSVGLPADALDPTCTEWGPATDTGVCEGTGEGGSHLTTDRSTAVGSERSSTHEHAARLSPKNQSARPLLPAEMDYTYAPTRMRSRRGPASPTSVTPATGPGRAPPRVCINTDSSVLFCSARTYILYTRVPRGPRAPAAGHAGRHTGSVKTWGHGAVPAPTGVAPQASSLGRRAHACAWRSPALATVATVASALGRGSRGDLSGRRRAVSCAVPSWLCTGRPLLPPRLQRRPRAAAAVAAACGATVTRPPCAAPAHVAHARPHKWPPGTAA